MEHLRTYVCRAADEFRAADKATDPVAAKAHQDLAIELLHLIRCDGNSIAYGIGRRRREAATQFCLPVMPA